MLSHMVLDTERARWLALAYGDAAYECDLTRRNLTPVLARAAELSGQPAFGPVDGLGRLDERLRADQRDIEARVRMVDLGGDEVNTGLWALDVVERHFATFDVGRDGDPETADGIVSEADLEAIAATRSGELAAAAGFLLAHPGFLAGVHDAEENDAYLDALDEGRFNSGSTDGRFDLGDIDAYRRKLSDWVTLLPYAAVIDVAAQGDPSQADGHLSADDFAALLDDPAIPVEVREAAERVLADGAFHTRDGLDWNAVGLAVLEAAGYVPVAGEVVDAARVAWYLAHGDWTNALIYSGGLLPVPGLSGGGLRAARSAIDRYRRVVAEQGVDKAIRLGARETAEGLGTYATVETTTWMANQIAENNETVTTVAAEGTAVGTRRRVPSAVRAGIETPG